MIKFSLELVLRGLININNSVTRKLNDFSSFFYRSDTGDFGKNNNVLCHFINCIICFSDIQLINFLRNI